MKNEPIGKLISYIHRQNQKELNKHFTPYGIGSGGQYSFLKAVLGTPGVNQDQLTQQLNFDKATTARSLKHLESEGYIERKPDPNDRRSLLVYPTSKAEQFRPTLQRILDETNKVMLSHLNNEEEDQIISLLQKIRQGFHE
ncbi:MarR family winged helix-turn-helix transcriptional regulator [Paenibacillus sp. 2TAB19]|uniref:MarR family winged helix-turn-helix transcriptional regulator n=1 Tax=Paenibacillus sp. 2TAB19 TaxID=3233003 RepID=UPI003F9DF8F1